MALMRSLFPIAEAEELLKPRSLVERCPLVSLKESWACAEGLPNTPMTAPFPSAGIPPTVCLPILENVPVALRTSPTLLLEHLATLTRRPRPNVMASSIL